MLTHLILEAKADASGRLPIIYPNHLPIKALNYFKT